MLNSVLEIKNIFKEFSGVRVLHGINLSIGKNEILGLVGENGAGKSTLMKILSGVYRPTSGEIYFKGEMVTISDPIEAQKLNINMVQQELNLITTLSVQDNITLGCERVHAISGRLNNKINYEYAKKALEILDINVDPKEKIKDITVANQQLIEISKNLVRDSTLLILDEPTTALNFDEAKELLEKIVSLKNRGTSIIYISHKLDEILTICDRVAVLRDGHIVADMKNDESLTRQVMINHMMGDKGSKVLKAKRKKPLTQEVFKVENLGLKGVLEDISFSVKRGEVVGFFGLVGSGRTELALSIIGHEKFDSGKIVLDGVQEKFKSPTEAIKAGVSYLTEDRKDKGIFKNMSLADNITISYLNSLSSESGRIFKKKERQLVESFIDKFGIKASSSRQSIQYLSGGNQQKALLCRCLLRSSKLVIVDEPTKGVDVGAKQEIYSYINAVAEKDKGVIVISSEIEEIMALCDRVIVMRNGRISAVLNREETNPKEIMHYAAE